MKELPELISDFSKTVEYEITYKNPLDFNVWIIRHWNKNDLK